MTNLTETEIQALLFKARVPAIAMLKTPKSTDSGTPGCWFGGEPTLPAEYEWPFFTYDYEPFEGFTVPMHFLAQINLQYVPRVLGLPPLPPKGTLFVFFDPVLSPIWPNQPKDFRRLDKAARVIFHPGTLEDVPRREAPTMPEIPDEIREKSWFYGEENYPHWPMNFVVFDSYPEDNDFRNGLGSRRLNSLKREQQAALDSTQGRCSRRPGNHRDQDTSKSPFHTIFGASQAPNLPTVERAKSGLLERHMLIEPDEILLFRFGVDDQLGHYYGGGEFASGYWIKRQDLEQENFDKIIMREDYY